MPARALVLGATGLVGRSLVGLLIKERVPTDIVTRRPAGLPGAVEHVADFSRLESVAAFLKGDDLYVCLGTTIKKAGSRERFRAVDYQLPLDLASRAAANGMRRLFLVSSNGADPASRNLYLKVKGELEQAVSGLPFKAVHIVRPSLLLGERQESRPAEAVAQWLAPRLSPLIPARYRPIKAEAVAGAMLELSKKDERGVFVHENEALEILNARRR